MVFNTFIKRPPPTLYPERYAIEKTIPTVPIKSTYVRTFGDSSEPRYSMTRNFYDIQRLIKKVLPNINDSDSIRLVNLLEPLYIQKKTLTPDDINFGAKQLYAQKQMNDFPDVVSTKLTDIINTLQGKTISDTALAEAVSDEVGGDKSMLDRIKEAFENIRKLGPDFKMVPEDTPITTDVISTYEPTIVSELADNPPPVEEKGLFDTIKDKISGLIGSTPEQTAEEPITDETTIGPIEDLPPASEQAPPHDEQAPPNFTKDEVNQLVKDQGKIEELDEFKEFKNIADINLLEARHGYSNLSENTKNSNNFGPDTLFEGMDVPNTVEEHLLFTLGNKGNVWAYVTKPTFDPEDLKYIKLLKHNFHKELKQHLDGRIGDSLYAIDAPNPYYKPSGGPNPYLISAVAEPQHATDVLSEENPSVVTKDKLLNEYSEQDLNDLFGNGRRRNNYKHKRKVVYY